MRCGNDVLPDFLAMLLQERFSGIENLGNGNKVDTIEIV
jgi:hypothetical protein